MILNNIGVTKFIFVERCILLSKKLLFSWFEHPH